MEQSKTYPEIYYPEIIEEIFRINLEPKLPSKPEMPSFIKNYTDNRWIAIILIIISFIAIIALFEDGGIVVFPIIVFVVSCIFMKKEQEKKEEHEYAVEYFDEIMEEYYKEKKEYERKKRNYENMSDLMKDYMIEQIRRKMVFKYFDETNHRKDYMDCPEDDYHKQGKSENLFFLKLKECQKHWGGMEILQNQRVKVGNEYYYPDIVILYKYRNVTKVKEDEWKCQNTVVLKFDIEIDEPYSLEEKKPIHYLGQQSDIDRNKWFIEYNWIVIRFAEKQILNNPNLCCRIIFEKIIMSIIHYTYGKKVTIKDEFFIPKWDRKQAIEMARQNYRDSYCKDVYDI